MLVGLSDEVSLETWSLMISWRGEGFLTLWVSAECVLEVLLKGLDAVLFPIYRHHAKSFSVSTITLSICLWIESKVRIFRSDIMAE